jgi:hypothetical protein
MSQTEEDQGRKVFPLGRRAEQEEVTIVILIVPHICRRTEQIPAYSKM